MMENDSMPLWLAMMFAATFFEDCLKHANNKKKELNFYCIDCLQSLCTNCRQPHLKHKFIQIRKYVYRNVVNVQDMKKYFDCSGIQTYSINSNKVVPLTQRQSPSKNQPNIPKNACLHCERSLTEPFQYCCLECKAFVINGKGGQKQEIREPSSPLSSSTLNADDNNYANTNNDGYNNGDPRADDNGDPHDDNNGDLDAGDNGDHVELPILVSWRKHARKQKKPFRSPFF